MRVISLHLHRLSPPVILFSDNNIILSTLFSVLLFILCFAVFIWGCAVRIDCIECNVVSRSDISICLELLPSATRCLQYSYLIDLDYDVDNVEIHRTSLGIFARLCISRIDRSR